LPGPRKIVDETESNRDNCLLNLYFTNTEIALINHIDRYAIQ